MTSPLTVCIPTFARSALLQQAFASVHAAALRYPGPVELLVYNDLHCQSIEADPACAQKNVSVRVVNTIARHSSTGSKRQCMVEMVQHQGWITWVDDDDLVMPWHLERLVHSHSPFVTWGRWYLVKMSANGTVTSMEHAEATGGIVFAAQAALYRTAGGFKREISYGEDNDLRGRLKPFGNHVIPRPSYVYCFRQVRRVSRLSPRETAEQKALAEIEIIRKEPSHVVLRPDTEPHPVLQALVKAFP